MFVYYIYIYGGNPNLKVKVRSNIALLLETEAYSSKPTASHGHLREVPALIDVQEAHFMANIARNLS